MLGAGVCFSTVLTAFRYTNGMRGVGDIRDQVDDDGEVERREELKKVRRRPLSETLQQLGEGRGTLQSCQYACTGADSNRNLRSRLRGEEKATLVGQVRHRRQGSARIGLEAAHLSLEFTTSNTSSQRLGPRLARVYTTSYNRIVHQDLGSIFYIGIGLKLSTQHALEDNNHRVSIRLDERLGY